MRILLALSSALCWFVAAVWGGTGILAVLGFFTQAGDGVRKRGLRSLASNAVGLLCVFVAPLSLVVFAARKLH